MAINMVDYFLIYFLERVELKNRVRAPSDIGIARNCFENRIEGDLNRTESNTME